MKTVKVRIAVAVASNGEWSAVGWSSKSDPQRYDRNAWENAIEELTDATGVVLGYWLEAELPSPEMETVQAKVISGRGKDVADT